MRVFRITSKVERGGFLGGLFDSVFGNPANASDFSQEEIKIMAQENAKMILQKMKDAGEVPPTAEYEILVSSLNNGKLTFEMKVI